MSAPGAVPKAAEGGAGGGRVGPKEAARTGEAALSVVPIAIVIEIYYCSASSPPSNATMDRHIAIPIRANVPEDPLSPPRSIDIAATIVIPESRRDHAFGVRLVPPTLKPVLYGSGSFPWNEDYVLYGARVGNVVALFHVYARMCGGRSRVCVARCAIGHRAAGATSFLQALGTGAPGANPVRIDRVEGILRGLGPGGADVARSPPAHGS